MAWDYFTNEAEADSYFTTERPINAAWTALSTAQKQAYLTAAYNRLYYDDRFNLPTMAAATATQLVILKKISGEMAWYLIEHMADESRRKGIQVQGVVKAGIVKEDYDKGMLEKVPIPPQVLAWLKDFEKYKHVGITDIARDENEEWDEDVTGF